MERPADEPPSWVRRAAWRLLRALAIAYLTVLLGMTFLERALVYPAPSPSWGNWSPIGDDYEDAWIDVPPVRPGGAPTRVHGWFFERPDAERAVLYCHGNGEDVSDQPPLARRLRDELEASVLAFDYRGYGQSAGKPDEAGVIADGLAAARWLAERTGRPFDEVIVIGRSLGGGVATAVAAEQGATALVLQNTFTKLTDAAAFHYPWLPVRLVMRNRFDSLERLRRYDGPVYVSHAELDQVVPFEQGERLFAAANGEKGFFPLRGAQHQTPQPDAYYAELRTFLSSPSGAPPADEGALAD